MYFDSWILHERVTWSHFQQFLHWGTPRFMLAPHMVAIYLPTLKHLLISILALLPLWISQMSIHTIDMSDLEDTLITLGLDTKEMLSNIWFCLRIVSTLLDVRCSWEFSWGKNRIPMILRYDFDFGSQGSLTCRALILLEFLTYWSMISRSDCCDTLLVMIVIPKESDWM